MLHPRRALVSVAAAVLVLGALVGCSVEGGSAPIAGSSTGPAAPKLPPTTGGFDYQLGGGYPPPAGVTVVTRDSTDRPAKGVYSICYVNGFQTQPGARWPSSLILHTPSGAPVVDPGWPDERIIDISTAAKRARAARRIGRTVTTCARKGFAAVEFDNLDSYSRSKRALTLADAAVFARMLVARAHRAGLAASQKNTAELAARGRDRIGFDFVTAEECDRYAECGAYTRVYGRHVYDIEYTDDLRGSFAAVCARRATPRMTVLRDRELVGPGQKSYVRAGC